MTGRRSRGSGIALFDVARIGRRVTARREALGLRQIELAHRAGLSEAYVNRLENGIVRNPKINDLAGLARALSVPLGALLLDAPRPNEAEPAGPETLDLLARQPRLALALASLARGLHWAEPEDQEFVLGHIEALARRFGDHLDEPRPAKGSRTRTKRPSTVKSPKGAPEAIEPEGDGS
jgi:transcriptional regulator with XRE-family HTH domain